MVRAAPVSWTYVATAATLMVLPPENAAMHYISNSCAQHLLLDLESAQHPHYQTLTLTRIDCMFCLVCAVNGGNSPDCVNHAQEYQWVNLAVSDAKCSNCDDFFRRGIRPVGLRAEPSDRRTTG